MDRLHDEIKLRDLGGSRAAGPLYEADEAEEPVSAPAAMIVLQATQKILEGAEQRWGAYYKRTEQIDHPSGRIAARYGQAAQALCDLIADLEKYPALEVTGGGQDNIAEHPSDDAHGRQP